MTQRTRFLGSIALLGFLVAATALSSPGPQAQFALAPGVQQKPASTGTLLPLPAPTGAMPVGTIVLHFLDKSRPDTIAKTAGKFRELMVQVWYPSRASPTGTGAPYIPDPALFHMLATVDGGYYGQSAATLNWWNALHTHSSWNAPVLHGGHRLPLLIFSPGLGITRANYTAFAEELASHGYVVAVIDHPYGGFTVLPDGRTLSADDDPGNEDEKQVPAHLTAYAADAAFVIHGLSQHQARTPVQFAEVIDFERIGMLGHSLGGAAALETCRANKQVKACADLDGAPFGKVTEEGVQKPTLLLLEDPDYSDADLAAKGRTREQWQAMGKKGIAMWASIAKRNDVPVYKVKIRGTGHLSFSDAPFVMPDTITRFGGNILDAQTTFDRITAYLLAFFNQYLKGQSSELLAKSPFGSAVTVQRLDAAK